MRYEPLEIKNLKLEKEYVSTFPVLIQLVQNTKELNSDTFYGTIGNSYNLAYSIELPELLEKDRDNNKRNFVKLKSALNNLKSIKLSKHDVFKDFYVIKITDYSSTSRSIGSYEFLPLVFMKVGDGYEKIPQNRVGLIKNFTSKEAFIIIDRGTSEYSFNDLRNMTDADDFVVDIYFKRRTKDKTKDNYNIRIKTRTESSITFQITNKNVNGKLSPIDLNRIRFTYKDRYLVNSSLFAKVEVINSAGETIELNRQLTEDDYFKFLYLSNYHAVEFQDYVAPTNTFDIRYTPIKSLLPITNDNYQNFDLVLSEDIPWYDQYTSKAGISFNKNNTIYWKKQGELGRLLITNNIGNNNDLFEVFPAYDNYERFVDVVHVTTAIPDFDIHKYLLKQKVFNYDSAGFLEIFNKCSDGSYVKSTNNTVKDDSFISFRFSNEYNNKILNNSIAPYDNVISSKENISGYLTDNITADSFVNNNICYGLFGDPTLNVISQNIASSTNNIIYPLDGNNERVREVIGNEEIRSYQNANGIINIGFSNVELSDFKLSTENANSIAVNMIRKKHAATINALYNKFENIQSSISAIKDKLKDTLDNNYVFSKSTTCLEYRNFSTHYFFIKPKSNDISSFDIEITKPDGTVVKREYGCTLRDKNCYILLPYYIMTTIGNTVSDRSGSGYIDSSLSEVFNIKCYRHLQKTPIEFYYKEGE